MCTSYIHLNNSFLPLKETTVLITSTNKKFLISPLNSYMKNIQVDTYNDQYSFGKKKKKTFKKISSKMQAMLDTYHIYYSVIPGNIQKQNYVLLSLMLAISLRGHFWSQLKKKKKLCQRQCVITKYQSSVLAWSVSLTVRQEFYDWYVSNKRD